MVSLNWVLISYVVLQLSWLQTDGQAIVTCKVDLAILVDQSGSIFDNGGVGAWYNMTNFTKSIIETFATDTVNSHISLIKFGHDAKNYTNGLIPNKTKILQGLESLKTFTQGETTNTSAALYMAEQLFDKAGNAMIGDRSDVPDVVILVTDGVPTRGLNGKTDGNAAASQTIKDEVLALAQKLKDKGVLVITVGVTDKTDPELLNKTASDPSNYIAVLNFATLASELNGVISTTCQSVTPPPDCRQSADVYFVLDSSGSIGETRFKDIRKFVSNMMMRIPIGTGSRAGILYFSNNMFMGFNLNTYGTMEEASNATLDIPYVRSSTNTASVIKYMRETAFSSGSGDQAGVPNIAVIFTDGNSNVNRQDTLNEAYLAKKQGIHIIVIGVTNWFNQYELEGMASDPYSVNYMHYQNSKSLVSDKVAENKLKALLCNDVNECSSVQCQCGGTCLDKIGSFSCQCPNTCSGVRCERNCNNRMDVVFALDSSSSLQESYFRASLNFVRNVIMGLNVRSGDRVAVVRFSTSPSVLFQLKDYSSKDALLNALTLYFNGGSTNTQLMLTTVKDTMFTPANGGTANPNVLVILTDGKSPNFLNTWTQARLAREAGINVITVGIGSSLNMVELQAMASGNDNQNVFTSTNYTTLSSLTNNIIDATCNNVAECEFLNCQNGATKVEHIGYCTCSCASGFSGTLCDRAGTGKVDIVLIIDSSGSIRRDRMTQLLTFIGDLVKNYPVGPQLARFGAIYFSDGAVKAFDLNTYSMAEDIITHLTQIPFLGQRTNIADAIEMARTSSFTTTNGDRTDARNFVYIFTDGASNIKKELTIPAAIKIRESTATVVVMGIGSDANTLELRGMASQPYSKMMMMAPSFSSITTNTQTRATMMKSMVSSPSDGVNQCDTNPCKRGTCVDGMHTYTCSCGNTQAGIDCSRDCAAQLDLTLVLDFSASLDIVFQTVIAFAREIVYGLPVPNNVRVAVVEYDEVARVHFRLSNFTSVKQGVLNALSFTDRGTRTNTKGALDLLVSDIYQSGNGDRSGIKNVAVVVTDGGSNINSANTVNAANAARNNGIELFVAAYGNYQMNEINAIANSPSSTHVVQIGMNNNVQAAANELLNLLCAL